MNFKTTVIAVSIFVSLFAVQPIFAAITPTPSSMMQESSAPVRVEYALPYPGILPDHPLYFLKRFRDQLMERLIADPVRKIEFYMLQADKNINMAVFLSAKKNETLPDEVLAAGKMYFDQAIRGAGDLKTQGKEIPPYVIERFTNAGIKYQEILTDLNFLNHLEAFKALQSEVDTLRK